MPLLLLIKKIKMKMTIKGEENTILPLVPKK